MGWGVLMQGRRGHAYELPGGWLYGILRLAKGGGICGGESRRPWEGPGWFLGQEGASLVNSLGLGLSWAGEEVKFSGLLESPAPQGLSRQLTVPHDELTTVGVIQIRLSITSSRTGALLLTSSGRSSHARSTSVHLLVWAYNVLTAVELGKAMYGAGTEWNVYFSMDAVNARITASLQHKNSYSEAQAVNLNMLFLGAPDKGQRVEWLA